jgi:anti-sigma factor RsiW
MDHWTIDSGNVVERYVTGRLDADEAASFEEHYLDCPECCARIEAAERLQRGFRRLAEQAAAGGVRIAAPPERAPAGRRALLALAAAALVALALLPAGLALREIRQLRGELAHVRRTPGRQETGVAAAGGTAAGTSLTAADGRPQALTNVMLVALTQLRGRSAEAAPIRTLTLPATAGWIALWVEPDPQDDPSFAVRLLDARGGAVFQARGLAVNTLGALLIIVPTTALIPGFYRLEVEGVPARGAPVPAGRFPLRVVAHH